MMDLPPEGGSHMWRKPPEGGSHMKLNNMKSNSMNLWLPPLGGRNTCAVALFLALSLTAGAAQQQQSPPPQRVDRTLNEGVTAVLVDVVVRDKRGQPVRDLALSDFQVLEDGVPQ